MDETVEILTTLRRQWKPLALTDVLFKLVTLILLMPLVAIFFRTLIAVSGKTVLTDEEILHFILAPASWIFLIALGALWIGIAALETAALLAILATHATRSLAALGAMRFAARNSWSVLRVAARVTSYLLLSTVSFLVVAGGVYVGLLSRFDINYYLTEKPPEFLIAIGIAVVLVAGLFSLVVYLVTNWFFALPIVLFEGVRPSQSLKLSRRRAVGHRRKLMLWIVGWLAVTAVVSSLLSAAVALVAHRLVPLTLGSLEATALAVGFTLLVMSGINLVVNLFSTISFAAILWHLYESAGGSVSLDASQLRIDDAPDKRQFFRVTTGRLLIGAGTGLVVAFAVGAVVLDSLRFDDEVTIIAHRGSSQTAPENTLAAISQAIADDTDWVEIDVQETADGEVVVFHDSDFMKLAAVDLKIWDATLDDLRDIDVGSRFDARFSDQRVPRLADVLEECKGKIGVLIELKYYGHDQELEQRVVDIVESLEMANDIMFMSLKLDAVEKMKALRPAWKSGLLMSVAAGDLKEVGADFLAVNAQFVDRSFVRSVHASDKNVFVWTVNDPITMSRMISRGVDGLITDRPALARSVLRQRAQLNPAERLLFELASWFSAESEISEQ